ncbi:MAG: TonB-dependent receptor [Acidobacteria bacterium]|nr:MAG: TonB-dependent receptor [Acidobacteriota bacterium]PYR05115.1 MAG: TonB-dependent receptor [Acidobacteriota bacterium]
MNQTRRSRLVCAIAACLALAVCASSTAAQGVTTAAVTGVVKDAQGAVIPGASVVAVHEPSGTTYEAVTQADGRFFIQGMRVGGPYKVTASLAGFTTEVKNNLTLTLGVAQDVEFSLKIAAVAETITVVGQSDPVFSSSHTGAATAVLREELATLPTISGRINDMTRLSPEYSGSGGFAGADNRMNNITVDGSYFNNSFGLGAQPGDRTNVAPISLEAIEQVQVSVAPYDVRQGNFVGAGVNTVTRSGTNNFTGSGYYRYRNESFVGTEAKGQTVNPGTFKTTNGGEWFGGPIIPNRLFFFESFESQKDQRPLSTYVSNPGGVPAAGNTTRVLASDLNNLSSFLSSKFSYDTGPFEGISKVVPGKPFLVKSDFNVNSQNKVTFRYNMLNSSTPVIVSGSQSLGNPSGRSPNTVNFLSFANSNYSILENIRSGIGEWNSVLGNNLSNNLIVGYTHQDESRGAIDKLFPFVDVLDGNGGAYTSFGSEPFTPNNELRYNTFQAQDSFTKFGKSHSLTFGAAVEKYHSENVFFPGKQSVYVYNTLGDFLTDANGYLANPNRTSSPVTLRRFQVRYMNIPGLEKPVQPLDVWYTSGYAQDEWRPRTNLTVTAGVRMDVANWGNTAFDNPNVDALTFRDQSGGPIQYNSGALPKATPLWSPRVGFNYDLASDQQTQLRGGTGVFTGKPLYVWISNQIGNTGMLTGLVQVDNTTGFPFNPSPDAYKPKTVTGAPATTVDLAVTDPNFKFPQTWRTNVAVDRKLPWGLVGTGEFIFNKDVNGMLYINANLPAAQSAYTGVDARPRWLGTACAATGNIGPCVSRINNAPGNQIIQNIVLTNESVGRQWTVATSVTRPLTHGFTFKSGYGFSQSKNVNDPGSIAAGSWTSNAIVNDPNNPVLSFSQYSPGHRFFVAPSYTKQYFGLGVTTIAAFFDAHTNGNASFMFAQDANGDSAANDLIYIPRDTSEMNFVSFPVGNRTFTAAEQAAAFEAFIQQDDYLRNHRGQYAERYALFYPIVKRMDLSIIQDVFHGIGGRRHSGQIRLDINNFGNLLNHDWGVGQIPVALSNFGSRILTNPTPDAQGRLSYRLATVAGASGTELISRTFQTTASLSNPSNSDLYVMMLSFRYTFQ